MSVRRIFKWQCDCCQVSEEETSYGLPDGWIVVPANPRDGHETLHFCGTKCHEKRFPKDALDVDDGSCEHAPVFIPPSEGGSAFIGRVFQATNIKEWKPYCEITPPDIDNSTP